MDRIFRLCTLVFLIFCGSLTAKAQSDNCNSATTLNFTDSTCVNGSTSGATSDSTLYCNANPVVEVWYTYTVQGGSNNFTVDPGTMTDPMVVIDSDGCSNAAYDDCATATGNNPVNLNWGYAPGTQVWIGVASDGGTNGSFELCVESVPADSGGGATCGTALPYCDGTNTLTPDSLPGQGTDPSCFGTAGNQSVWVTFSIYQNGSIEWDGTPLDGTTEFDWALYDISSGCPGTQVACNYNFAGETGCDFGMDAASTVACPPGTAPGTCDGNEYCPDLTGNIGETYGIFIDNWTGNGTSFDLDWTGSAEIKPEADFSVSPTLKCGSSVTVNINDNSNGDPQWSFGDGTTYSGQDPPSHTYSSPGVYAITAKVGDTSSCFDQHTEYVKVYGPLTLNDSVTQESCPGACDGEVFLFPGGGSGQYTYSWSHGPTTPNVSGLCAGSYSVTVTDTVCGTSINRSFTISSNEPTALSFDPTDETCSNANGVINITGVTGGDAPYEYDFNGTGYSTDTNYTGLSAGTYSVTVRDSSGCTYTDSVPLKNFPPPTDLSFIVTDAACGNANGEVVISGVTGGTSAYQYDFDGSGYSNATTYTGLSAGTYSVTVNDSAGCTYSENVTVDNMPGPSGLSVNITHETCTDSNGVVDITGVTGGTTPYQYDFDGSGFSNTTTYNGLTSGTYLVTVKDSNGCVYDTNVTVNNSPGPSAMSFSTIPDTCGAAKGEVDITGVTGGTTPYEYDFDGSGFSNTTTYTGLLSGSYVVTVRDANGCTYTDTAAVGNAGGPSDISFTLTDDTCASNLGAVEITGVTGGTTPYEYDFNGSGYSNNTTYTGLAAGTYSVTVRDANGCLYTESVTLNNVPGPSDMSFTLIDETCTASNGEVSISGVTGGTSPYEYDLDGSGYSGTTTYSGLSAGAYTVTVRDDHGCTYSENVTLTNSPGPTDLSFDLVQETCGDGNGEVNITGVTGGTTPYEYDFDGSGYSNSTSYTGLAAGTYTVMVRDSNGCTYSENVTLNNLAGPTDLSFNTTAATCGNSDGSVSITGVTGGNGSYEYDFDGSGFSTTTNYNGLATGTYTVTVRDTNNCNYQEDVTVPQLGSPKVDSVKVTGNSCNAACDGALEIFASGGTTPYQYSIDGGSSYQNSSSFSGLCADSYDLVVQDANGCADSSQVSVTEPSPLQISLPSDTTICIGGTAVLNANASGGTPGYTYHWDQGLGTGQTQSVSPNNNTVYTVYAEDANGCTSASKTVRLELHPGLSVTALSDDSICPGTSKQLSAVASGGIGSGYSYSWSTGTNGKSISVTPGSTTEYIVTLEDACETPAVKDTVTLALHDLPNVQIGGQDLSGCKPVNATLFNATPPSMVGSNCTWDLGDGSNAVGCDTISHRYDKPGCYDVSLTVSSPAGCVDSASIEKMVCVHPYPNADFRAEPSQTDVMESGVEFINKSTGASSFQWDFAGLDSSEQEYPSYRFPTEGAGNYEVCLTATSTYGCQDSTCERVIVEGRFTLYVPNAFTPNGDGVNDKFGPVIRGADRQDYNFYIFDRWGEQVFESHHPEKKWDGSIKGDVSEGKTDVYVWKLVTKNKYTGDPIERTGHVTLIR